MIIGVNEYSYKLIWLKLVIEIKLQLYLTPKEYDILKEIAKYDKVSKDERKQIAQKLKLSPQIVTNNIKKLKDKKILTRVVEDSLYYYKISFPIPKDLNSLLLRKEVLTFTQDNF